jgi:anti-sigma-K factor RskA
VSEMGRLSDSNSEVACVGVVPSFRAKRERRAFSQRKNNREKLRETARLRVLYLWREQNDNGVSSRVR